MNPGINFANWLQQNVAALFSAALAVFGLIVLIKRKIMAGIILLIIAGFGALLVFNGSGFAQKIANLILSWFN